MNLRVLSIFLCMTLAQSLTKDDPCITSDGNSGICASLKNCKFVDKELANGKESSSLCGYSGYDIIVCCPTKTPMITTLHSVAMEDPVGDGRGAISRQKCAEYSKFVFAWVPPQNPVHRQLVNVSQCAIKYQKLIVGGTHAERKEFPHMAAVGFNLQNAKIGWYCGGTLISETFVLTAAHCIYSLNWGDATWVRLGDINLSQSDDRSEPVNYLIIERIRHPDYKPPSQYHDIALLRLESPVTFNGWIRPACLHTSPTIGTQNAIATGWGRVNWIEEVGSSDLLKVTLPLVDLSTCNAKYNGTSDIRMRNGVIGNWSICAGDVNKDTCLGDSGGPLVIFSKDEYYCMYDVIGVTSLGKLCGSVIPGVYTRVYNYIAWIETTVWGRG